jgi:hypothetical protein
MADDNAAELARRAERRFSARQNLDNLRQEIAEQFFPHLAEWTTELILGEDYADHLMESTPLLLARDFIAQIGAMLRPPGKQWFLHRSRLDEDNEDTALRQYYDLRSKQQMRIMTDRRTGFGRACKSADEFFGGFGDACLSVDYGPDQVTLRFLNHHTKDVVWAVGSENVVDTVTRREQMPARVIKARWPKAELPEAVKRALSDNPDQVFETQHHVLPIDDYEPYQSEKFKVAAARMKARFASVWILSHDKVVLSETPQRTKRYVCPRWQSMRGQPYAMSPASMIALPDARLIQEQALALQEAAEKSANPPLVAYEDTIKGDVELGAGRITWVDRQYDEKTGQPIYPLDMGKNFPLAAEVLMRTEQQLAKAFYLDTLRLPDTRSSKSVQEIQFRIDEYVRAAVPLFTPIQDEYNAQLLYEVDDMIEERGGYDQIEQPQGFDKEGTSYQWDNPLTDLQERAKAVQIGEIAQLVTSLTGMAQARQVLPEVAHLDFEKMTRSGTMAIGGSPYLRDPMKVKREREKELAAQAAAAEQEQSMQTAERGSQVASNLAPLMQEATDSADRIRDPSFGGGSLGIAVPFGT